MNKLIKLIFILIIFLGIFLRIYNIENVPPGLFADEIALGINAKIIAEIGADEFGKAYPFGFESFSDYKLPGYIYTTAIFHKLFGPGILTIRLAAILSSILTIPLLGYLTYLLFKKQKYLPFLAMAVLSLSPFHIHFGRIAYETTLATFFLTIFLISLLKALNSNKNLLWISLGGIALIFSSWTYPAPHFIIPVFTISIFLLSIILKFPTLNRKKILQTTLTFFIFIIISYVPSILFPEIDKRTLEYVFKSSGDSFFIGILNKFLSTLSSYLRIFNFEFLFLKGDFFGLRHGTKEAGIYLSIFSIPLIIGIIYFIKQFSLKNFNLLFLGLLIIIAGLPSSLTYGVPYGPRLIPVLIPLSIIIGIGAEKITEIILKQKTLLKISIILFLISLTLYQTLSFYHTYSNHFPVKSLPEFPKSSIELVKDLKKEIKNNSNNKIYFLNGKSCLPWGYDVLKFWYFADLNNKEMIKWNNIFKKERYNTQDPFGVYDSLLSSRYSFSNIVLNSSEKEMANVPKNSLLVRCGYKIKNANFKQEKLLKIYYMYNREKKDINYFTTKKI